MLLYYTQNGQNQYHFRLYIKSSNIFLKIANQKNVAHLLRTEKNVSNSNHMKAGLKLLSFPI